MEACEEFPWEEPYGGPVRGVAVVIPLETFEALKACQHNALRREGAGIGGVQGPLQVVDVCMHTQTQQPMMVLWGYALPEKEEGQRYQVMTVEQVNSLAEEQG